MRSGVPNNSCLWVQGISLHPCARMVPQTNLTSKQHIIVSTISTIPEDLKTLEGGWRSTARQSSQVIHGGSCCVRAFPKR